MIPAVGSVVQKYRIIEVLGGDSRSVLLRVRHEVLNSNHVMKFFTLTKDSDRERMRREANAQAAIKHRNIAAVTDVIDIDGCPATIMEYIDGPNLGVWMHADPPHMSERLALFLEVIQGVRAAHRLGIVHRGLTPSKVLLEVMTNLTVPKVVDFASAKLSGESMLTTIGDSFGKPPYTAPEQLRNAADVDQRADIFSLGTILYELCTGQQAFPQKSTFDIMNAMRRQTYIPAEDLAPQLPPVLARLIDQMLAPEPEDRLADLDQVEAVLKPFATGEQASTVPTRRVSANRPSPGWGGAQVEIRISDPPLAEGDGNMAVFAVIGVLLIGIAAMFLVAVSA